MATADGDQPEQETRTIRIDLTSLDLRSGTVRLPLQQHDYFPTGNLTAQAADGASKHILQFEPPRDLHGLQAFFQEAELRPNDAVIIHVTADTLKLEAFHRKPRRSAHQAQESEPDTTDSDTGLGRESPALPPQDTDTPLANSAAAAPDKAADGTFDGAASAAQPETGPTEPAAPPARAEAEPAHPAAAPPEPQPLDPAPERAARFPFLGTAAGTFTQAETGEGEAEADGFEETFTAPAATASDFEAEAASTDDVPAAEPEEDSAAIAPATGKNGSFHATRRRPFRPRERGPAYSPEQPAAPWLEAAKQTRSPEEKTAADDSEPASLPPEPASPGQPDPAAGPAEAVRALLQQPDLPSIIQAADVARRLDLEPDEAAAALATLSTEPDSRLSSVRPGFWLLKRPGPDN